MWLGRAEAVVRGARPRLRRRRAMSRTSPSSSAVGLAASPGPRIGAAAAVFLVALAALQLLWASRGWRLVHDAPIMHYVAWQILEGAAPYRDLFDMNFPGVYAVHLLVLATLGPGDLAFRLFDLVLLTVTGAGLWAAVRSAGPWGGPAAAALFGLYHVAGGPWLAGQRELLLCALLAWSAAGAIAWPGASSRARPTRLAGAALALGTAVWVKPHAALLVPFLVWWVWSRSRGPVRGRALATVGAGLALPGVAFVTWLGWAGGLAAFTDITLGYLIPLYSRLGRSDLLREIAERDYGPLALLGLLAWAGLGAAVLALTRRRGTLAVLATGLGYGAAHFWLQGRGWEYHFYPLALFAVAVGGAGLGASVASRRGWLAAALVIALAVTAAALWTKGRRNLDPAWIEAKLGRVGRVSAALQPLVDAGGTVQVLDTTDGGIHALLRLKARQPSRFLYDFHFHHDASHPYVRRLRAELIDALRARPPAAVVVFAQGWPTGGYERVAGFPELQDWLSAGYRLSEEGDGYRLYVGRLAPR
jgi:hypothetical protein